MWRYLCTTPFVVLTSVALLHDVPSMTKASITAMGFQATSPVIASHSGERTRCFVHPFDRPRVTVQASLRPHQFTSQFSSSIPGATFDIDAWMDGTIASRSFSNITDCEAVDLIRRLRDAGAYRPIARFAKAVLVLQGEKKEKRDDVYAAALDALCRSHPGDALHIFHEMEALEVTLSSRAVASAVTAIGILYGHDLDTLQFWQTRLLDLHPRAWTSPGGWDATLMALGRCGDAKAASEAALSVYRSMKERKVPLRARTYQTMFQIYAEAGAAALAESLLDELVEEDRRSRIMTPRLWGSALGVFAALGDGSGALRVLSMMQGGGFPPTVHHFTLYLNALLPDTKRMLSVLMYMSGDPTASDDLQKFLPVPPDTVSVKTVLRNCGMVGDYSTARQVLSLVKQRRFGKAVQLDESMYNLLLAACDEPAAAKAIVGEMRLSRRHRVGSTPPSPITYTQAITVCRRASDLKSAEHFLKLSRADGLKPDVFMYTAAIWTAAKVGDSRAARQFLAESYLQKCSPNEISYNGVLDACARSEEASDAKECYLEMIASGLNPSGQTFNLLARSIRSVENATVRAEWLREVYSTMNADQRTADVGGPIIEGVIQGLGVLNRFDEALETFESVVGPSDARCLRAILSTCSIVSPPRWKEALSILHESDICSGTTGPTHVDPIALSYAMLACSKADQFEESLNLFQLYGGSDTPLPAINSLIGACGRRGRPDMALSVLNDVEDRGIELDARSYRSAIVACNQGQHRKKRFAETSSNVVGFEWWECALSLLRRMKERGLRPDMPSYASCISACEAAGQWQAALALLQSVLDDEEESLEGEASSLNLHCFNAAISACAKGGAWIEAVALYELMKSRKGKRLRPTIVTIGSLIEGLDRAGQKDLATRIHQEGVHMKFINPWRITRASTGESILAMDLHSFSAAMARAAIRGHVDSIAMSKFPFAKEAWTIVVGKGLRSDDEPVLLPTTLSLLRDEYGIEAKVDPQNCGRVVVPFEQLQRYVTEYTD
jgi:pentatricopeptide repeat protein